MKLALPFCFWLPTRDSLFFNSFGIGLFLVARHRPIAGVACALWPGPTRLFNPMQQWEG